MIDYIETKKTMEVRGIDFDEKQFSFSLMVAIGMDKLQSYLIAIKPKDNAKIKDKNSKEYETFIDKCKKDCEILLEQQNVKQLTDYLTEKYELEIADKATNSEEIEVTPKMLKGLLSKIIKRANDNLSNTAYSDIIKVVDAYCKQFPVDTDDLEKGFAKHFIQVYPTPFNGVCPHCNREIDIPYGLTFSCPHCMTKMIWDADAERYRY